jgi:hypothetical protein
MRIAILAAALLATASAGCNSSQLRFTTLKLSQTVPNLQQEQVLDNLARIASDSGSLPYYTVISTGTTNIADSGSGGLSSLSLQHRFFPQAILNATASRTVTGNWTLNTMVSPDRLRAMRAAYQIALGIGPVDPVDLKKLQGFEDGQGLPAISRDWLCVGTKHDIPKEARFVAHRGDVYVWVKPDQSKLFADFALLILNIATVTPSSGPSGPTQISLSIDKLPPIQIREPSRSQALPAEPLPEALPTTPPSATTPPPTPGIQQRLYEDSPSINRGLFFVPR